MLSPLPVAMTRLPLPVACTAVAIHPNPMMYLAACSLCRTAFPQMLMAGFLPFSAIYVELYYIFASVWGHKVYIIWSILFIVYIILIIVTAFITVALTYFQLAVEDHRYVLPITTGRLSGMLWSTLPGTPRPIIIWNGWYIILNA